MTYDEDGMMLGLGDRLLAEAEDIAGRMIEWRRSFHQFPEIGMEEYMTASKLEEAIAEMPGVEVSKGFGLPTCLVARVGGDLPGPALAFRAEMDAVEVGEETGLPFSSFNEDVSHVQGHDAHMATALGALRLISDHRDELERPVVFIFQPGEEGKGGARLLTEAGVLEKYSVGQMLCLHWMPSMQYGTVFLKENEVTALSSKVHIGLSGQGGHGSTPHLTSDPLFLAAQLQVALQTLITREVSAAETAVLSFGRIEAGEAYNVIATETHLWGTLRSDDRATIEFLRARIEEVAKGLARLAHLAATVEYMLNYEQVSNDPVLTREVARIGASSFGPEAIGALRGPLLVGEDLSFFTSRVPSCLMFLGTGMEYGLYHARYDIPENLLPFAAAWCATLALSVGTSAEV